MSTFHTSAAPLPTLPPPSSTTFEPRYAPLRARRVKVYADDYVPSVDVLESLATGTLCAMIELPGLSRTDVTLAIETSTSYSGHNELVVQGDMPHAPSECWGYSTLLRERRTGAFRRTIPIPKGLMAQDIHAKMDNGLLVVTFPKVAPTGTRLSLSAGSGGRIPVN
ncbi:hypothetical protein EXIGLDRAFT_626144 [Exidia glandulosa HHB12029]|uniref:SHSP domain-containing protein n=1 Tax=Exidia glandulosa HHB12029 TaxID=1314781 RepID=A0A165ZJ16_EXIGL|nr:hypothetical protein EXIGLDRAFT_626144 [Exidia glandulosa HHB12029]